MEISVIISTYNRCQSLNKTLDCLCQQRLDRALDYEVIVVDNNSKDKTKEVVASFSRKDPHVRYIFEARRGLSNARNTGIDNAKGRLIAFTDDDVIIDKTWLSNIAHFTLENEFDAVGGKVLPLYPHQTPQWVKDNRELLSGPIVCHYYGEQVRSYDISMRPFVGANMIIKQEVFKEIGGFNSCIGAGKGSTGDDTEFFHRLKKAGKNILYNPKIVAIHPVEKERMGFKYIAQWNLAAGRYRVFREREARESCDSICYFGVPRYLFRELMVRAWALISSLGLNPKFIDSWGSFFWQLGRIQAYHGLAEAKSK